MRIKAVRDGINDLIWKLILLLIIGGIHVTLKHFGVVEQMVDVALFILTVFVGMSMIRSLISMTKCFIIGGNYFKEKNKFKFLDMVSNNGGKAFITIISYLFFTTIGSMIFPLFIIIYIYSFFQRADEHYEVDDFDYEEEEDYKKEFKEKVIKDKSIPKKAKVEEKKYEEPPKETVELEPGVVKGGKFILKCESFSGMSHNKIPKDDNYGFKSKEYAIEKGMSEYGKSRKWWVLEGGLVSKTVYQSWK